MHGDQFSCLLSIKLSQKQNNRDRQTDRQTDRRAYDKQTPFLGHTWQDIRTKQNKTICYQ